MSYVMVFIRYAILFVLLLSGTCSVAYGDDKCREGFKSSGEKSIPDHTHSAIESNKGIDIEKLVNDDNVKGEVKGVGNIEVADQTLVDILNYNSLGEVTIQKTSTGEISKDYYLEQFNVIAFIIGKIIKVDDIDINGLRITLNYFEGLKLALARQENKDLANADFLRDEIFNLQASMSNSSLVPDKARKVIKQLVDDSINKSGSEKVKLVAIENKLASDKLAISNETLVSMVKYINSGKINIKKNEEQIEVKYYVDQIDEILGFVKNGVRIETISMALTYFEGLKLALDRQENKDLLNAQFLINRMSETQVQVFNEALLQHVTNPINYHKNLFMILEYTPKSVVDAYIAEQMRLGRRSMVSLIMRSSKGKRSIKGKKSVSLHKERLRVLAKKVRKFLSDIWD